MGRVHARNIGPRGARPHRALSPVPPSKTPKGRSRGDRDAPTRGNPDGPPATARAALVPGTRTREDNGNHGCEVGEIRAHQRRDSDLGAPHQHRSGAPRWRPRSSVCSTSGCAPRFVRTQEFLHITQALLQQANYHELRAIALARGSATRAKTTSRKRCAGSPRSRKSSRRPSPASIDGRGEEMNSMRRALVRSEHSPAGSGEIFGLPPGWRRREDTRGAAARADASAPRPRSSAVGAGGGNAGRALLHAATLRR